jgi:hypothetical protein
LGNLSPREAICNTESLFRCRKRCQTPEVSLTHAGRLKREPPDQVNFLAAVLNLSYSAESRNRPPQPALTFALRGNILPNIELVPDRSLLIRP